MSNEYRDWLLDQHEQFNANVSDLDLLPTGWTKTFVPKMKEELFNMLGPYVEDFIILDAKEKYGQLRVYWTWEYRDYAISELADLGELQKDIDDTLFYYESLSKNTCVVCGKSTTHISKRYELPMCESCIKKSIE